MPIKIALAGNPNSGKTTMFNSLTGSSQRVGNWPGVTVEKKEGKLQGNKDVIIQDLPGIYSLSPYTPEEVVARDYLVKDKPDVIINIVDATNIERNLYLTTQLMEIGIPVVIALNMMDIVEKNGDKINISKLSEIMGCEVVETSALKKTGTKELSNKAIEIANWKNQEINIPKFYSDTVEKSLVEIEEVIASSVDNKNLRWNAIKFFENDEKIIEEIKLSSDVKNKVDSIISKCEEELDDSGESIITGERYEYITEVVKKSVKKKSGSRDTISDKVDRIVTHRVFALPIFAAIMFLVYYISISTVGTAMTDWVNDTLFGEMVPEAVGGFLESVGCADWLSGLILDGIIGGVGAVLGFLPQMLVLFLCLSILEECGYMSRIAFIMDRVFRKFGLSGKSFIPMLISTGCGVPGIMASRTIENDSDRRMTVMTTTFIPCGAKLPIIALIAGALFNDSAWVASSAYFLGVVCIIVSGIILKKTRLFAGDPAPFVMELPAYHMPTVGSIARTVFTRGLAFVKKAGTIILVSAIVLWFLQNFNTSFEMVEADESILAAIGGAIAPIFSPLGWGDWKATVATFTGLIAKENVVGTFGVLYGVGGEISESGTEYWSQLAAAFTPLAAYSFLAFNLLCAPCFAAIGALRREMMSGKWTAFAIAYQCGLAYVVSLIIFQIGSFAIGGGFTFGTAIAIAFIIGIVYMLFRKPYDPSKKADIVSGESIGR